MKNICLRTSNCKYYKHSSHNKGIIHKRQQSASRDLKRYIVVPTYKIKWNLFTGVFAVETLKIQLFRAAITILFNRN